MYGNALRAGVALAVAAALLAGVTPAAAQPQTIDDVEHDDTWTTGQQQWQGESLLFVPDQPNASMANAIGYGLYSGHEDASGDYQVEWLGREISLEFQETADGTPYAIVPTDDVEGYISIGVNGSASGQVWADSDGVETDRGLQNGDGPTTPIAVEDLRADLDPDSVEVNATGEVWLDTNRHEQHTLTLSSPQLGADALAAMFSPLNPEQRGSGIAFEMEGEMTEGPIHFDPAYVSAGQTYSFSVESTDSTGSAETSIDVVAPATPTPTATPAITTTPEPTPTPSPTPINGSDSGNESDSLQSQGDTPTPAWTTTPSTNGTLESQTDDIQQPGFGATVGVVALLATALLARRRS